MNTSRSSSLCRSDVASSSRRHSPGAASRGRAHNALFRSSSVASQPRNWRQPAGASIPQTTPVLTAESGQSHADYKCEVERLEREIRHLRQAVAQTPKSQDVPLRDLVERELSAYGRSSELQRDFARMAALEEELDRTSKDEEYRTLLAELQQEQDKNENNEQCITELYKELETMDSALQQARQEIGKLMDERSASQASHERDVVNLEHMLQEVMAQNQRLQEALDVVNGKTSPTSSTPRGIDEALEKSLIAKMIQSGISYSPAKSYCKSASTSTPPLEAEIEELEDCSPRGVSRSDRGSTGSSASRPSHLVVLA